MKHFSIWDYKKEDYKKELIRVMNNAHTLEGMNSKVR